MVRYFFAFIFLVCSITVFCQPSNLSYQKMLEDFDSLQGNIQKYCAFVPVLEKRTGISVNKELNKLKKQIRTETTVEEFADLVRQGLNILNDGHTEIANSSMVKWWVTSQYNYLKEMGNVSLSDTLWADYYNSCTQDSVFTFSKSGIRAKYINGKY